MVKHQDPARCFPIFGTINIARWSLVRLQTLMPARKKLLAVLDLLGLGALCGVGTRGNAFEMNHLGQRLINDSIALIANLKREIAVFAVSG